MSKHGSNETLSLVIKLELKTCLKSSVKLHFFSVLSDRTQLLRCLFAVKLDRLCSILPSSQLTHASGFLVHFILYYSV